MELYHYSNIKFEKFDLRKSGCRLYSMNDFRKCGKERFYFYTSRDSKREDRFYRCKYEYTISIDSNLIYNLDEDTLGLLNKVKNMQELYDSIIACGYHGLLKGDKKRGAIAILLKTTSILLHRTLLIGG